MKDNSQRNEIIMLRETIQSLENLKKENYFQLAKATEALSDLRKHPDQHARQVQIKDINPRPHPSINDTVPHYTSKAVEKFEIHSSKSSSQFPLETSFEDLSVENNVPLASGLVKDWQRKNDEIKLRLKELQKELEGDRTMTIYSDVTSPSVADFFGNCQDSNPRQQLEKENKLLMDIVSQVRSDLQKANMTSPSASNGSR